VLNFEWALCFRPAFLAAMLIAVVAASVAQAQTAEEVEPPEDPPGPLSEIPVPLPKNLDDFVRDRQMAIVLGKALFWDMQVGSDAKTACATCHFHAGGDSRVKNTLAPRTDKFRGANERLYASDFPFHRLSNPRDADSRVTFDTSEVVGSAGVVKKEFVDIVENNPVDIGVLLNDPIFNVKGKNVRQVTGRNAPTVINAVFNDRQFWDGRANRFFNGVDPFGDHNPDARVWQANGNSLSKVKILLDNASLASQAVGPPNNEVEMAWNGRTFPELGMKMLSLPPLAKQKVHSKDSVLGKYADTKGDGLKDSLVPDYATLVKAAFHPKWWNSTKLVDNEFTHMEANFSLFWGLSIMLYESTLVSDDTPFDRFAKGDKKALSKSAQEGLRIFLNEGKCINCHSGAQFTGATVDQLRKDRTERNEGLIEFMLMEKGPTAFYDGSFYNIGVRPTAEDVGVGGSGPFGPFALSRRKQLGFPVNLNGQNVNIGPKDRIAVDGAFKTPGLRNVELTGPYMHNGGMKNLEEVVLFYARRVDFFKENIANLDPDVDGVPEIVNDKKKVQAVVDFLYSLTDERVRKQAAPFDHPELVIPEGHKENVISNIPILGGLLSAILGKKPSSSGELEDIYFTLKETGDSGGEKLKTFEDILEKGR
jgi:cytochrome c peroxidase